MIQKNYKKLLLFFSLLSLPAPIFSMLPYLLQPCRLGAMACAELATVLPAYFIEAMLLKNASKMDNGVEHYIRSVLKKKRSPQWQKTAIVLDYMNPFGSPFSILTFSNSLLVSPAASIEIYFEVQNKKELPKYQGILEHEAYHLRQRKLKMFVALGSVPLAYMLLTAMWHLTSDTTNNYNAIISSIGTFIGTCLISKILTTCYLRHEEQAADNYVKNNLDMLIALKDDFQEKAERIYEFAPKSMERVRDRYPRIFWFITDPSHPSLPARIEHLDKRIARLRQELEQSEQDKSANVTQGQQKEPSLRHRYALIQTMNTIQRYLETKYQALIDTVYTYLNPHDPYAFIGLGP